MSRNSTMVPSHMQCVGRRLEDEKVLEMTGIIADLSKRRSEIFIDCL